VKEIHGYRPEIGLSVFTQAALDRRATTADYHDRDPLGNGRLIAAGLGRCQDGVPSEPGLVAQPRFVNAWSAANQANET
jgi:hypothetical protein